MTDVEAPEADAAFDGPKRGMGPQQAALQITNDGELLDNISALLVFEEEFSSGNVCATTRGKDKMLSSSSTSSGGVFRLPYAKKKKKKMKV